MLSVNSITSEFVQIKYYPDYSLGSNQTISNQSVVTLGLKHHRLGTHTPVIFLGNDSDKFPNLSKSFGGGSVQIKPDQIKPAQIKVLSHSI
jgi:hypothetical protein